MKTELVRRFLRRKIRKLWLQQVPESSQMKNEAICGAIASDRFFRIILKKDIPRPAEYDERWTERFEDFVGDRIYYADKVSLLLAPQIFILLAMGWNKLTLGWAWGVLQRQLSKKYLALNQWDFFVATAPIPVFDCHKPKWLGQLGVLRFWVVWRQGYGNWVT